MGRIPGGALYSSVDVFPEQRIHHTVQETLLMSPSERHRDQLKQLDEGMKGIFFVFLGANTWARKNPHIYEAKNALHLAL